MNKIIKWITWALMIVGIVFTILVFVQNGSDLSVNLLLYWAYAMVALAIASIVYGIVRDSVVNPKNIKKIGIVLVGAVVLVGLAYVFAPGTPAVGYVGTPVSDAALKLTDTVLNLTYFSVAAAILAVIAAAVMDSAKK
ncbi:MAG: hypothetical protein KBS53_01355 [Bacteroidales bacterium]|nr:hypothetical protein [Candidatus Hennigimonas equi]